MNNTNTIVYVKVRGKKPAGFIDPPNFVWDQNKEKKLWSIISKLDSQRNEIDWKLISETLNAPDYFLKKRSYKLFAKHLELLQKQIDRKELEDGSSNGDLQKLPNYISSLEEDKKTIVSTNATDNNDQINNIPENKEHDDENVLEQLQASKIMGFKRPSSSAKDDNNGSDSEISSNLSVSKSALEEALMDKLHF
ncbi:hypothetical protein NCAS_0C01260 [Naumovozyma castellii]|uniref:Autophagy-related protein 29 n=1 Tax=Naumovozyma castellii TaxID=27288 RepID=G0VCA7_NAUCA|nr:hypothetical protein NCAS_0C01260 [Naumovozyma castellii CBS 4309]CCC69116.1 hypothetical protein NCAS_0C01260 [Naumovozyma castellii CBS 4309]